jgi:hypothetical protein
VCLTKAAGSEKWAAANAPSGALAPAVAAVAAAAQ